MSTPTQNTSVYPMVQAQVCPMPVTKVPSLDPKSTGTRNRKRAAYCSVAIINELEGHADPIILQGEMPQFLIDGDSLQDIKNRLFEELEEVFKNAQDVLDGKITIEGLKEKAIKEHSVKTDVGNTLTEKVEIETPQ